MKSTLYFDNDMTAIKKREVDSMAIRLPTSPLGRCLEWLTVAMIHFGLSQLIIPVTMALTRHSAGVPEGLGMLATLLVRLTKLLHFPIVTLALYPREWFPGDWVYLPMAANSLVWGFGVSWLVGFYRKAR